MQRTATAKARTGRTNRQLDAFLDDKQKVADLRSEVLTHLARTRGPISFEVEPIPFGDESHQIVLVLGNGDRIPITACYDPGSGGTYLDMDLAKFSPELKKLEELQTVRAGQLRI